MSNIFERLHSSEEELVKLSLKYHKKEQTIGKRINESYSRKMNELKEQDMEYEEYNRTMADYLKKITRDAFQGLYKIEGDIALGQKCREHIINLICYYSCFSIFEISTILNLFGIPTHLEQIDDKMFLISNALNNPEIKIEIPKSNLIYVFRNIDDDLVWNPILDVVFTDEIKEYFKYVIDIKHQDIYVNFEIAYKSFQEKDCIKR